MVIDDALGFRYSAYLMKVDFMDPGDAIFVTRACHLTAFFFEIILPFFAELTIAYENGRRIHEIIYRISLIHISYALLA